MREDERARLPVLRCRCSAAEPYTPVWSSDWKPDVWSRLAMQARRADGDLASAVRAMLEEHGVTPCTYGTCHRKASHVWHRTEDDLRLMNAKRQYRALRFGKRAPRPRKAPTGHTALPVFYACSVHVPRWRADRFQPFQNEPSALAVAA